jgi:uncharacterized protein (DUF1697 family)
MAAQTTYVALLRGVNLGGRRVAMAPLRDTLQELGLHDVRTYLQSGNAVFSCATTSSATLTDRIETALGEHFGFAVPTVVRTAAELAAVVAANPYPDLVETPTRLVASFLSTPVPADVAHAFDLSDLPEDGTVGDRVVYLHYPNGQGESKLTPNLLHKRLGGIWGTARNWRTVLALRDMSAG